LLCCERTHLLFDDAGRINGIADVDYNQSPSERIMKSVMDQTMNISDRTWSQSLGVLLLIEPLEVLRSQLLQFEFAQERKDV
jgi:hypothetical protein